MAYKNTFDFTGECSERGAGAETLFKKMAIEKGYAVRDATFQEQIKDHIDFFLSKNGVEKSFEIKARKKTSRADANAQDEWIWIEFLSTSGKPGWLYGLADYVGFQVLSGFLFLERKVLVEIAEKLIDRNVIVSKSSEAHYRAYRRRNRPRELVGMLALADLRASPHFFWKNA